MDKEQRIAYAGFVFAILFAISSLWTALLDLKTSDNKILHTILQVLFTTILTEVVQFGSSKLVRNLAVSDAYPVLLSRFGYLIPVSVCLTIAVVLDIVCLLVLFADDSCNEIIVVRVYPFLFNIVSHYIMPGIIIKFVQFTVFRALGKQLDQRAELDKLFALKEKVLELRLAGLEPLLT